MKIYYVLGVALQILSYKLHLALNEFENSTVQKYNFMQKVKYW